LRRRSQAVAWTVTIAAGDERIDAVGVGGVFPAEFARLRRE
jgi:hypothetical protein